MVKFIFELMGFYISNSGYLHAKTWLAKFMANMSVRDGHFVYLGRNVYKLNKEK
jgi:hypothetical protein